jgi:hypothetical protein
MNKELRILEELKVDTDADATSKGFLYQYLITLLEWLEYYHNQDIEIYCETEDDIKILNLSNNSIIFTQVKAYAKNFTIKSEEVKKTLANFYLLFHEYKEKGFTTEFIFQTNSEYEGEFFEILEDKVTITPASKQLCIQEIKKVLKEVYQFKNKKKTEKLDEAIRKKEEYINSKRNSLNMNSKKAVVSRENEKNDLIKEKKDLENKILELNDSIEINAESFFDQINWKADKKDKESAIEDLLEKIKIKICDFEEFKIDVENAYDHLINKVLLASAEKDISKRKLNKYLMDEIKDRFKRDDEFRKQRQNIGLLLQFKKICDNHKVTINLITEIKDTVSVMSKKVENLENAITKANPIPSDFEDFLEKSFDSIDAKIDFYKKSLTSIKRKFQPIHIYDEFKEKLFYPFKMNEESLKEDLSKKEINEKFWVGWLEFLCVYHMSEEIRQNFENIILLIEKESGSFVKVKLFFTNKKRYEDFLEELIIDDKDFIQDVDCLIFNSENSINPLVYPKSRMEKIVSNIGQIPSTDQLNPSTQKRPGVIHHLKLIDLIADSDSKDEFLKKLKGLLCDVTK